MVDILRDLPRLSWRGIEVPISKRTARFVQGEQKHRFVYRDQELVESTGTENIQFSYTIPFRQGVARHPYSNLFLITFTEFYNACRDRTTGYLIDPVLGPHLAKCTSFDDETDVNRRDGDDVNVEFLQTFETEGEEEDWTAVQNLTSVIDEAGALDDIVASKQLYTQEAGAQPTVDPLLLADSLLRMAQFKAGQVAAALSSAAMKLEKTEQSLEALEDVGNSPLIQSTRRLRDSVNQLTLKVMSPGRKVNKMTVGAPITLSALCAQLKMDLMAFLALNPLLAALPEVPKGTTVFFYGN